MSRFTFAPLCGNFNSFWYLIIFYNKGNEGFNEWAQPDVSSEITTVFVYRTLNNCVHSRYKDSTNPYACKSNVGRFTPRWNREIPTNTTIGRDCYSDDKLGKGGVSWVVLHEVCHNTNVSWHILLRKYPWLSMIHETLFRWCIQLGFIMNISKEIKTCVLLCEQGLVRGQM